MRKEGAPNLGSDFGVQASIEAFKTTQLATQTAVRLVEFPCQGSVRDQILSDDDLNVYLDSNQPGTTTAMATAFFINRYLVKGDEAWPSDANKLRLSSQAFEALRSRFALSPPFLQALANIYHASPRYIPGQNTGDHGHGGQGQGEGGKTGGNFDFWFFLPVRVQVQCLDVNPHRSGSKGRSQMNPLNHLHLALPGVPDLDIRGCKVAVYYSFDPEAGQALSYIFNFQDGRWRKVVQEPILRFRDMLRSCPSAALARDPVYLHMAVLHCVVRWWDNALHSCNDQLVAYEEELIRQDLTDQDLPGINSHMNQALHCMAAHLHRYGSELQSLCDIVQDIRLYNSHFHEAFRARGMREPGSLESIATTLDQITSHLSAISDFRGELQQKLDNVLALLVDNTKVMSDRLVVQNSKAMHGILLATQVEAESSREIAMQSHRLSEEMVKDSVAMKTIAVLTTFFLPGTSFAAILAMPFFSQDAWLGGADKIWIWFALTIPTTLICFWFYISWSRRESRKKTTSVQDVELQGIGASPPGSIAAPLG